MKFILRLFTWWDGKTLNTQFWTWRYGEKVGEDAQGNVFYQTRDGKRRWVIYNGESEASRVSAEWHGWLHQTYQDPPTEEPMKHQAWEKPHQENLTGSVEAYAPAGSMRAPNAAPRSDYEAWTPN